MKALHHAGMQQWYLFFQNLPFWFFGHIFILHFIGVFNDQNQFRLTIKMLLSGLRSHRVISGPMHSTKQVHCVISFNFIFLVAFLNFSKQNQNWLI